MTMTSQEYRSKMKKCGKKCRKIETGSLDEWERGGNGVDGIGDGKNVLEYWWVLVDSAVHCMAIRPMLTMANRLFSYYAIRYTTRWDVSCSTLNCGHAISVIPFHTQYSIGHATLRAKRTMAQSMCVRRHLWYIWQELNPTEEERERERKR